MREWQELRLPPKFVCDPPFCLFTKLSDHPFKLDLGPSGEGAPRLHVEPRYLQPYQVGCPYPPEAPSFHVNGPLVRLPSLLRMLAWRNEMVKGNEDAGHEGGLSIRLFVYFPIF